nr:type II toxin-antitoxin system VapC family toxin [Ferrovum sp.]
MDTNVLVRYIAQDDSKQSPKATRLIESLTVDAPGYVSIVSVVELVWVLTGCYALTRSGICEVLETLLRTKEIIVANADILWKAVRLFKEGKADFADCLIERSANEAGCNHTATFDRDAARHCGMQLIE